MYLDILPQEQRELYPKLSFLKEYGFILFGGTAIALQLGHRESIDFDFFNASDIDNLKQIILSSKDILRKEIIQNEPNALSLITQSGVKLSFFGGLDFVNRSNIVPTDDHTLLLADMNTLLATKLKVINDRAEYKDYKDIVEILKSNKTTLKQGLQTFNDFYNHEIPEFQILKGLQYFEDGDLYKLSSDDKMVLNTKIKAYDRELKKLDPSLTFILMK
jgi:hypothetical protein